MRRVNSWKTGDHTFTGESPTATMERGEAAQTLNIDINDEIQKLEFQFFAKQMTPDKLLFEFQKLYMKYVIQKDDEDKFSMNNRLKLFYAHQALSGAFGKRNTRRALVMHWVGKH